MAEFDYGWPTSFNKTITKKVHDQVGFNQEEHQAGWKTCVRYRIDLHPSHMSPTVQEY